MLKSTTHNILTETYSSVDNFQAVKTGVYVTCKLFLVLRLSKSRMFTRSHLFTPGTVPDCHEKTVRKLSIFGTDNNIASNNSIKRLKVNCINQHIDRNV